MHYQVMIVRSRELIAERIAMLGHNPDDPTLDESD